MKRILAALLAGTMAVTSLVGCSSEEGSTPVQGNQEASTEDALKVALLIPGNLGDKLIIQLGVVNKCFELSFLGENIVL